MIFFECIDYLILVMSVCLIYFLTSIYISKIHFTNIHKPVLFLPIIFIISLGIALTHNKGEEVFIKEVQNLINISPTYSHLLTELNHENISLTTSSNDPLYLKIIEEEKKWLYLNKSVSDIYTLKIINGKTHLLVDSETDYDRDGKFDQDREQRTQIGEIYDKLEVEIMNAYKGNISYTENPYTDRWGQWFSVLSPIYSKNHQIDSILGIDYSSSEIISKVNKAKRGYLIYVFLLSQIYFILITSNLIMRKKLEVNLELQHKITSTQENMVRNAKLASLGELSAGIAHEINNPLAIIVGKASTLKSYIQKSKNYDPKVIEDLDKIENTSFRIHKIVQGLKKFSRSDKKFDYEVFSLKNCIQDVLDLCLEKFKANGLALNFNLHSDVDYSIRGSSILISQVFMNILNNSFDAIQCLKEKWIDINFNLSENNENINISITDSGTGLDKHVQENIMKPFYTTKEVGKGTGLGLSISKGIIEEHGGKIFYEPNSKNTTFVISLPIHHIKSTHSQKVS